jgi:hypothetical protein
VTVSRLLTKPKHFTPILLLVLVFPAAALAAKAGGGGAGPRLADAVAVAPSSTAAPLRRQATSFNRLVDHYSRRVEAEERAAARRRSREARERFEDLPGGVSISTLEAIASCESGGDPTAVSSDGSYRGKYQFDYGTWESVGGSGDPAAAPEAEQDYRAALLYSRSGSSPWPVCG